MSVKTISWPLSSSKTPETERRGFIKRKKQEAPLSEGSAHGGTGDVADSTKYERRKRRKEND